jgi:hypothetical protein
MMRRLILTGTWTFMAKDTHVHDNRLLFQAGTAMVLVTAD